MRWFKLTLAYDGTAYAGWQIQVGQRTIQGELEGALARLGGQRIPVVASGRTDAGVHALGQVVSFSARLRLSTDELRAALNATTPPDILVREVQETAAGFHAIRDARSKRYRYVVHDDLLPDVFAGNYAWHVRHTLDEQAMRRAAALLVGRHDFSSFEAAGSPRASSVRTVSDLQVQRRGRAPFDPLEPRRLVIEIEADGFLYNMVRNIVGSLVEIGRGKQPVAWLEDVLAARDRRLAGATAPPQGLFLMHVCYD